MCQYLSAALGLLRKVPDIYKSRSSNEFEDLKKIEKSDDDIIRDLEAYKEFQTIGIEIYNNLNLSVLSGSYAKNYKFKDKLEDFNKRLGDLQVPEELPDIKDQFILNLSNSIKTYQILADQFHEKINNPDKLFLLYDFEFDPDFVGIKRSNSELDLNPYADLFRINISISIIDQRFSLDLKKLQELCRIEHYLKKHKLNDTKILKIILDKCNLLITKFKPKYDNDEYFRSFLVSHNFNNSAINPIQTPIDYLKDFQNIIVNLYPKNKEENYLFLEKYYREKNGKAETFQDFFIFVQFHSKISKNITEINSLISNYEEKFKSKIGSNKFYDKSYYTCYNYLFNNKISLFCKNGKYNINDIMVYFCEITALQKQTGIYNFFPYYKLTQCCVSLFQQLIENVDFDKDLLLAQRINDKLEECLCYWEKYLTQSKQFDFLYFQPNFEGCCCNIKIEEEPIDIFLASAYVIPSDYKKYEEKLTSTKAEFQTFKTIIATQKFINATKKANEKSLNIIKKQSKGAIRIAEKNSQKAIAAANDSQKNNIQILSVFAALVIFAMSNFQVYRMVKTFQEALIFTLILAFSLCLFSIVIWFIVSKKKNEKLPKTHKIICWLFVSVLGTCIYATFFGIGKDTPIVHPVSNNSIQDSLKTHDISIQNNHYYYDSNKNTKDSASILNQDGKKK